MDYQSNSRKEREGLGASKQPDKKIEKVITGDVIQKPKGIGYKFKHIFLGANLQTVASYVGNDILLPALKNLIWDMISEGSKKAIFGESSYRRSSYDGRPRVQYNNPVYRDPRSLQPSLQSNLPDQRRPYRANRRDMNDIILVSREEAELVVERLLDIIDKYQVVAVADLYDLIGVPTTHVDNKWGWTYLNNVEIRQIREGYLIELPPLEEV